MNGKILIADDENRIRILVRDFLEEAGYEVIEAKDGQEALDLFYDNRDTKLVILDVMMPFYDGFEVAEELKQQTKVPVLMLTARNAETDELKGFTIGVDDYVRKPFSPTILVARVNALFARVYGTGDEVEKGLIRLSLSGHSVSVGGAGISLSQREYELLHYLMENEGMVLSRDQILYKVWGYDYEGTARTVDTHMNRLRNKIGIAGTYIRTVRGFGYKFETEGR